MTELKWHVILVPIILQIMSSPTFICQRHHVVHQKCRILKHEKSTTEGTFFSEPVSWPLILDQEMDLGI